uniref:Uncharacterized protein n=1 Tax=Oryza sativa subsp. japonica TaxID=39947 RepID=Q67VH2_ORYSJ|nr:hypothetical protein [Oryza sativa Japonica Group]
MAPGGFGANQRVAAAAPRSARPVLNHPHLHRYSATAHLHLATAQPSIYRPGDKALHAGGRTERVDSGCAEHGGERFSSSCVHEMATRRVAGAACRRSCWSLSSETPATSDTSSSSRHHQRLLALVGFAIFLTLIVEPLEENISRSANTHARTEVLLTTTRMPPSCPDEDILHYYPLAKTPTSDSDRTIESLKHYQAVLVHAIPSEAAGRHAIVIMSDCRSIAAYATCPHGAEPLSTVRLSRLPCGQRPNACRTRQTTVMPSAECHPAEEGGRRACRHRRTEDAAIVTTAAPPKRHDGVFRRYC